MEGLKRYPIPLLLVVIVLMGLVIIGQAVVIRGDEQILTEMEHAIDKATPEHIHVDNCD